MKHIVIPRWPTMSLLVAACVLVLHIAMCMPAATSRGYPPIHPFWETIAPFVSYLGFILCGFFDDREKTLKRTRYVFVPAMCYFNGLVSFNLNGARPRPFNGFGLVELMTWGLPAGLLFGVFFLIFAYPVTIALEYCSSSVWAGLRGFAEADSSAARFRFSIPALLGLISFVALACAAGIEGHRLYDNWPRFEWSHICRRNLKQIALAMHAYHDAYGTFPPAYLTDEAGRPIHSWRVMLLPYLEPELHEMYDFNEAWDGPNNGKLIEKMPDVFSCRWDKGRTERWTSYVVVTGPECIFNGASETGFGGIPDGSSNTILVVERSESEIPWTAPLDLSSEEIRSSEAGAAIRCDHGGQRWKGAHVALGDGSVRWLGEDVSPPIVQSLLSANGGESIENW